MTTAHLIDTADIPSGGTLQLVRCGDDFEILFGEEQLMGSWVSGSEQALAKLSCGSLSRDSHVLIGGLGMGFTLAAALSALPDSASIVVAELVPKVVTWARGPLAHLFQGSLADPRVSLNVEDVHEVIVRSPDRFDAILLDVDNGPDGLIQLANERLYCNWGLRALHTALRPGGVLAIWSAFADAAFATRLHGADFEVEEIVLNAEGQLGEQGHMIWLARRRD